MTEEKKNATVVNNSVDEDNKKALEEARAADRKVRRQDYAVIILGCSLVLLAKLFS
ncbi:hypothetical protein [Desulfofalx alkaliphila]|uniref:hypothetical protein n=1 Tax=Desulfofalx alkaliphila TaxID=105483 RepID=UPI000A58ED12|nr:hypothetical protein [Desulfofalx alkaliphila]